MRSLLILAAVTLALGVGFFWYLAPMAQFPIVIDFSSGTSVTPSVSFRVLDTGTHAADVSLRKNYAAYSQADIVRLWELAHGTDGAKLPMVDVSKEYVVGVFAGQKPTGGHSVSVASIVDNENVRTVFVTLTKPGEGCMVTEALTNPYQIIAVPFSDASLTHKDTEVVTACN